MHAVNTWTLYTGSHAMPAWLSVRPAQRPVQCASAVGCARCLGPARSLAEVNCHYCCKFEVGAQSYVYGAGTYQPRIILQDLWVIRLYTVGSLDSGNRCYIRTKHMHVHVCRHPAVTCGESAQPFFGVLASWFGDFGICRWYLRISYSAHACTPEPQCLRPHGTGMRRICRQLLLSYTFTVVTVMSREDSNVHAHARILARCLQCTAVLYS